MKPKQFKKLQQQWYKRLKNDGFHDIEAHGLEKAFKVSQRFAYQDEVRDFYSWIENVYLGRELPTRTLAILKQYCAGKQLVAIEREMKLTRKQVRIVIEKVKKAYRELHCGRANCT